MSKQQQQIEDNVMEEESSSSDDEDSNGELINDSVSANFLSALVRIKNHDKTLYDLTNPLFKQDDFGDVEMQVEKDNKRLSYKDMERQNILNQRVMEQEQYDEDQKRKFETPAQQKRRLKQSFKKAVQGYQEQDTVFKIKKPQAPKMQQQSYNNVIHKLAKNSQEENLMKRMWGAQKQLDQHQDFLRKYILQKGWVDTTDQKLKRGKTAQAIDDNDDKMSEQVDDFQATYNFRYQQPGSQLLQTFPRNIDQGIRQKTKETRSQKRKRKEEQKKKAFQEELKQIERLKTEKKNQIVERIQQLKSNSKVQNIQIQQQNQQQPTTQWFYCDDCERGLKQGEVYYECETCQSFSLCGQCYELIIHKHKLKQVSVEPGYGAPDDQQVKRMLAQLLRCKKCKTVLDQFDNYFEYKDDKTKLSYFFCQQCQDLLPLTMKKRCTSIKQKKVKLNQALDHNPEVLKQMTLDDQVDRLIEEYNALDVVEGIDGKQLKCKFNYIQVKPQSFGLSDQQLLFSDDKQLQKYVSITRLRPYSDKVSKVRNTIYKKKIGSIQKSANANKQQVQEQNAIYRLKNKKKMQLYKKRLQRRKALIKRKTDKVRLVDLSQKNAQIDHFVSKDRLASYTL